MNILEILILSLDEAMREKNAVKKQRRNFI